MSTLKHILLILLLLAAQGSSAVINGTSCVSVGQSASFTLQYAGAQSIYWILSGNGYISSGQYTDNVIIVPTQGTCNMTLEAHFYDGDWNPRIESKSLTLAPYITAPTQDVYPGELFSANTINPCGSACSYSWDIPGCVCISGPSNLPYIQAYPPPLTGGNGSFKVNCTVNCNGTCSSGITTSLTFQTRLRTPTNLTASAQTYCSLTTPITFSVNTVAGAGAYSWTLPTGWAITSSPATSNTVTVTPDGIHGGTVSVKAVSGSISSNTVNINMPLINDDSRHNLIAMPNSQFMYVGTDQKLHHRRWDGTQWAYTAINPAAGGWGNIRASGWLATNDLGTRVFFKTTGNRLYYLMYSSNMWLLSSVPSPTSMDVKGNVVWRSDGVFYVGMDNYIYRATQSGTAWTVTRISPPGWQNNLLTGSLALDPNPGGNIYFRANNNRIYNIYNLGASNYATPLLSDMGINCVGEIAIHNSRIYFKAPDNKIHYVVWNGSSWIESTYGANVAYSIDGFMTFDNATDKIFYKGTDAKAHNIYPVSPGSSTYADGPLDNNTNVAGDLAYMDMKVFYISKDNKIHDFLWNGTSWYDSDFPLANAKNCSDQYTSFGARPAGHEEHDRTLQENTGISAVQQATLSGLTIYPNPTQGLFTIEAEGIASAVIDIYDARGRKIQPVFRARETASVKVDLSSYPGGLYMVHVTTSKYHTSKKILLQQK